MHIKLKGKILKDYTGIQTELPVILTERGPLLALVDYLLEKNNRSWSWKGKVVRSVGLLLDYMDSNAECFGNPIDLFRTFIQRLYSGTICPEDGRDPSDLYWRPRRYESVKEIVEYLSSFSDWLAEHRDTKLLNPLRPATSHEEKLAWAAWHHKNRRSFLAHLGDLNRAAASASRIREILPMRLSIFSHDGVKFFPENRIYDLLYRGFAPGGRLNIRNVLITLLMHYGGLRMSEPFHLYVHDVIPAPADPDLAIVRIYHPSQGIAPPDWPDAPRGCIRAAYLRGKYCILPRTDYPYGKGMHAGWKDPRLDHKYRFLYVYWFPPDAGRWFMTFWKVYLLERVRLFNKFNPDDHPFAFVSSKSGRPYAIGDYEEAHAKAVKLIGLTSAKMHGTTPHGHRHSYGQRLTNPDAGISSYYIMRAMHHKRIDSQEVYTEPTIARVTNIMLQAETALEKVLPEIIALKAPPQDILSQVFPLQFKAKEESNADNKR